MWDLMWQEYRYVGCESVDVVTVIPVRTKEEQDSFWQYFNNYLQSLSPQQKLGFMNKG
jgi:hypothetical protein